MNRRIALSSLLLTSLSAAANASLTTTVLFNNSSEQILAMSQPPGDSTRLFLVSKGNSGIGKILLLKNDVLQPTPMLQVSPVSTGGEQGLLGLAFDPNFQTNGYFFIDYSDANAGGTIRIVRYKMSTSDPDQADPASAYPIMSIAQPNPYHNGGTLRFGPDGMLWFGKGDAGMYQQAQTNTSLLGKFLRIDVRTDAFPGDLTKNYSIPADNPYAGGDPGLDEVWSIGWRNPWKWSFDRPDLNGFGGLFVGEVGLDTREELDYEKPGDKGRNYGWPVWEGNFNLNLGTGTGPYTFPFYDYPHTVGISVSGGMICRDPRLGVSNWGRGFYGDWNAAWFRSFGMNFNPETGSAAPDASYIDHSLSRSRLVAVECDNQGRMYLCRVTGQLERINETSPSRQATGTVTFSDVTAPPTGVTMEILSLGGTLLASLPVGIPAGGAFKIPVLTGSYQLSIKSDTWLRKTIPFNSTGADVSGLAFVLTNGDIDGDNEVGLSDFGILSSAFGTFLGDPGYSAEADLDRDGEVSLSDFGILSSSFGEIGD